MLPLSLSSTVPCRRASAVLDGVASQWRAEPRALVAGRVPWKTILFAGSYAGLTTVVFGESFLFPI